MSKILKIAAIALAVVVLSAGALLLFVDVDQFRPMIQNQLESSLKRQVTLGKMGLKLIPLSIRVEQVSISDDPVFGGRSPFLSAKEIAVRVGLLPLLRKTIRVDSLRISEPSVELIRNADGRWNFSTLGKGDASGSSDSELAMSELILENGRIGLLDHQRKKPRAQYDDIDLVLRDLAPGKPFTAGLTMRFPDKLAATANLKATYEKPAGKLDIASFDLKLGGMSVSGAGNLMTAPTPPEVNLQLKTEGASITELAKVAAAFGAAFSSDMKVTGILAADVRIQGPTDALLYAGNIGLTKLEVTRPAWNQPIRVTELKAQLTPQQITTNPFFVESGTTRLTASAAVQDYAGEPKIRAEITTNGANLQELINVAQAYGISAAEGIEASNGTISLDVKVAGGSKHLDFSGSGSLQNAVLQLPSLAQPLKVTTAGVRFTEGSAVLENMVASLGGSTLKGSAKVKNFASPEIEFNADVDQLNVAEMQRLTKQAAPTSESKKPAEKPALNMRAKGTLAVGKIHYGSFSFTNVYSQCSLDKGLLKLDPLTADLYGGKQRGAVGIDMRPENATYALQTKFERVSANELMSATTNLKNLLFGLMAADSSVTVSPKPGEDIARSLNGKISLNLNDGRLAGVSIVNEMAKVAKVLGYAQKSDVVTNILSLTGSMRLDNGVASTDDLKLAFDGGSLSAAGTVGLVDNSLKLKVTSVLSRAMNDQFGGSGRIAGYMSTALGNSKGELVIPCLVSGTTSRPVFTPDGAEFAKLKLQNIIPTVTNPSGIADTVKGVIGAGKQGGGKGVGGALLDMFGGRKKSEEKKQP